MKIYDKNTFWLFFIINRNCCSYNLIFFNNFTLDLNILCSIFKSCKLANASLLKVLAQSQSILNSRNAISVCSL